RYVRPVAGFSGGTRLLWQRAADREDVRRAGDVAVADGARLSGRDRQAVRLQPFDRADREILLGRGAAERRSKRQPPLGRQLVEVGGRDHALRGAVLADEYHRRIRRRARLQHGGQQDQLKHDLDHHQFTLLVVGKVIWNVAPESVASSPIWPPLTSTAHFAIARPSPAPPISRERPSSMR